MGQDTPIEELIELIQKLDRPGLIHQFRDFPASFPIDLTADFLDQQPVDRLRHIFLAVYLQTRASRDGAKIRW